MVIADIFIPLGTLQQASDKFLLPLPDFKDKIAPGFKKTGDSAISLLKISMPNGPALKAKTGSCSMISAAILSSEPVGI